MHRFSLALLVLVAIFGTKEVSAIVCYQCNGWNGDNPLKYYVENTCDKRNNECQATKFCVKITDAMNPSVSYQTFKSDCSEATTLQVTTTNLTTIVAGQCYSYQDGSTPTKKYSYCYCNDKDYCNSSELRAMNIVLILVPALIIPYFV